MVSGRIEGLMDKNGFAKEAVKESKVYTKGWRTEITGLAEFEPLSSTQVSFDDLAEKSEVHTLVLDSLLVAVYERNEYFQTRFDPRVSNDADRISYFTYIAQTTSELIAIPTDVVSRTYREYHPEHMQASARHCSTLVNYLERCIGSGEFMHEEPDLTNEVVKRRATNRVFYRGKDWDVRELVGMGKAENFMLSSMEEMVLQTIDDHRSWLEHHREEQEQRKAAAVKQAEQEGLPEEEDLMPYRRKKVTQNGQMYEKNKDSRRSMRKSASLRTMDASEAAKMEVARQNAELFRMFLIPPKHPKKILWDSFMGCVIIFSVILVPYRIGFDVQPPPGSPGDAIDWLVDIVFAIDICLSFRTAYVDRDGQMVTDWNKIRKNYVAGFFWIDLLSTIPFDRIFQVGRGATLIRVVRLIRLVKLLRLVKLTKLIDDLQELGISQRALNSLILVSQLTFLAHLLACGFFFVYDNQSFGPACQSGARFCSMAPDGNQGEQTGGQRLLGWFKEMDWLIPGGENEDYISALYWSFTTMTTVGYGDITPRSTTERIYCIFVMFVGGSAFGYIIGSIAASGTDAKEISMKPVYDFCDRQGLATVVRTKLRKHMTFYMEQKSNYDERTYLLELPVHLRIEVLLHIHREALASLRLFRPRLLYRDWFIAHIVSLMRPMVCVAGDLVYSKGQKDPYNVYSIFTGVCEAVDPDTEQVVAVYTHGMVFGLEGALTPTAEQIPKEDDNGYPCSVTAQPMVVPGSDRETVELFVLKQDVIQSLEDSGSVYFHPLKKLVATAWIQQKHDPYTVELSRRKKKVRDYLRAEMYKKRRGIVRLPRCYTSFTTIDGDDPDVGGGVKKSTTPAAASHGGAGGAGVITAGAQQGDGAPAPPGSAEKLAGGGGLLLSPDAFADVPHMQGRQVAVSVTHSGVATDSGTTAQGDFAPPGAAYERKEDYIISVPPGQDSPDVTLGHLTETTTVSLRSVSGIGPRNMMGTFIITPTPTRASTTMRSAMREVIDEGASPMSGAAGSVTPASPGGALLGGSTPGGSNMDVGGATPGATPALPGESAPPAGAAL